MFFVLQLPVALAVPLTLENFGICLAYCFTIRDFLASDYAGFSIVITHMQIFIYKQGVCVIARSLSLSHPPSLSHTLYAFITLFIKLQNVLKFVCCPHRFEQLSNSSLSAGCFQLVVIDACVIELWPPYCLLSLALNFSLSLTLFLLGCLRL